MPLDTLTFAVSFVIALVLYPIAIRSLRRMKAGQVIQDELPDSAFAFPKQRKEPLTDARHVRNALARFNQVEGGSRADREEAKKRIERAARKFGVELSKEPD